MVRGVSGYSVACYSNVVNAEKLSRRGGQRDGRNTENNKEYKGFHDSFTVHELGSHSRTVDSDEEQMSSEYLLEGWK